MERRSQGAESKQGVGVYLQGHAFAPVPDAVQQTGLSVLRLQQLQPHAVVDVEEVVCVGASVLHHLLWEGPARTGERHSVTHRHFYSQQVTEINMSPPPPLTLTPPPHASSPDPPVGELVAFVRVDVAEVFEQVVERVPRQVEGAARLMRVEQVHHVHAEVSLQPLHVRVGAVENLTPGRNKTKTEYSHGGELVELHGKVTMRLWY